jgi:predicted DNA-binding protein YlxM (UPF0122 family)
LIESEDKMDKKQLMEMFEMRLDGLTFQEIADKYGFTKQYVDQELKIAISEKQRSFTMLEKYPQRKALAEYLDTNKINLINFSKTLDVKYMSLMNFMYGKSKNHSIIWKIIKFTGLTYEQLMKEEYDASQQVT